jgi:hypothetical protein
MAAAPLLRYVLAHWSGRQSLKWSFWVNLVSLRLIITAGQTVALDLVPEFFSSNSVITLGVGILLHGPVFVWQVVGVLRAGESSLRSLGSITDVWGAQLGILIAIWLVLTDVWGIWLATKPPDPQLGRDLTRQGELATTFDLSLSTNGQIMVFDGEITLFAAKTITAMVAANPAVKQLTLTSAGGNIYAARGVAKLLNEEYLDTHVIDDCNSACTLIFIAGVNRRLDKGAKLGFHQYRLAPSNSFLLVDPDKEQAKDKASFRRAGVSEWFLDRMFASSPDNIWFPSDGELRRAGVVTAD